VRRFANDSDAISNHCGSLVAEHHPKAMSDRLQTESRDKPGLQCARVEDVDPTVCYRLHQKK
jgi:hypothetical protein